jgi:hypothetical protein
VIKCINTDSGSGTLSYTVSGTGTASGQVNTKVNGVRTTLTIQTTGSKTGFGATSCTPQCSGKSCGDDGCGGNCGACSGQCILGNCVNLPSDGGSDSCTPHCSGKSCGSDGCGGTCGSCSAGESCSGGTCQSACVAKTCSSLGKTCGLHSDGCGGRVDCGKCASKSGIKTPPPPPPVGGGCNSDSECSVGEQCKNNKCVKKDPIIAPPPPIIPGGCRSDAECSAGEKCDGGLCVSRGAPPPPPPSTPGGPSIDGLDCCVVHGRDGNTCYRTTKEVCESEAGGLLHTGNCEVEDACERIFPCVADEERKCEIEVTLTGGLTTTFPGTQTCLFYNHLGSCNIEVEDFKKITDQDNDGDPDATDCAPTDFSVSSVITEACGDGIDNNCNNEIDEEGCDKPGVHKVKGLVGQAYGTSLQQGQLLKSASVMVSLVLGIILSVHMYHHYKRKKSKKEEK